MTKNVIKSTWYRIKRNINCVIKLELKLTKICDTDVIIRAETNIRNVTNEPLSKQTNIRIFVRFDE